MRLLALIAGSIGCLLVCVGGLGLNSTNTGWDILGRSGLLMGLQPDHWRGHWLGTALVYISLGVTFLCFAIGLWRGSRSAAIAWCMRVNVIFQQCGLCCLFFARCRMGFSRFRSARWRSSLFSPASVGSLFAAIMQKRSNQPMEPTATWRNEFSVFAMTPYRGLSLSR